MTIFAISTIALFTSALILKLSGYGPVTCLRWIWRKLSSSDLMVDSKETTGENSSSQCNIEKLDGKNFILWQAHLKDILLSKGLWEYVNPDVDKIMPEDRKHAIARSIIRSSLDANNQSI